MNNLQIGKVCLNMGSYDPDEVYTDGEIENEILRIVQEVDDYKELILPT